MIFDIIYKEVTNEKRDHDSRKGADILQKVIKGLILLFVAAIVGVVFMFMQQNDRSTEQATTRQVTDSLGETADIPVHPKRVVFLNVSNMDLYVAAGGKSTIVGRPTTHSMTEKLQQEVGDIPEVGIIHSPNVEKILELQPDLVIGVNVPFHTKLRETLQQNGIPLYINSLDNVEDTERTLTFYGELIGNEKQASEQIQKIQRECDDAVAAAQGKEKPKVLLMFSSPDSANMATAKSFSGDLVRRLGAVNIADNDGDAESAYVPLSMEYVLNSNFAGA